MTLKELIRLLEMANPSTEVSDGFGLTYIVRPLNELKLNQLAFFPAATTTVGKMLELAQKTRSDLTEDVDVYIAPLGEPGKEITLSMVLDWIQGQSIPLPKKIELIENPDLAALQELLKKYADFVQGDDYYSDNDYQHYIYEGVIDAFFGRDFWTVLNGKR